ncbi:MAG: hybrid sensor histidine kinase/response regulator [Magnetococcales bacterium]|nr:hybrid sensor histidine kinase/response regulator [Magnetococcales bacterium]
MSGKQEKPKVLVVDDSPETLDMLMHLLSDRYAAVPARSGENALHKASQPPHPDIILLDIVMPDMDGFEVCRRLKAQAATRDIPVLFLTAVLDQESELHGLNLGAVDYIRKPISVPTLQARLATHLELACSRKELVKKNEVLEEVVRLREDLERITKHDLKGPLSTILGFSEVVLDEADLSDYHAECLRQGIRAAHRMLEMINRSLDLYRIETGRYRYEPQLFDVAKLTQRVCNDLAALARRYSVTVVTALSASQAVDGSLPLLADATLCYFILANLIKNALEAAPPESQVTVTIDEQGSEIVRIAIHNQGVVAEAVRARFFEKYETFGKSQGTGLGTYSAQLMARAQGGRVTMESSQEGGTVVAVHLPYQR